MDHRGSPLLMGALAGLLLGCSPADELRLHLAEAIPDPLSGAAALRVTYNAGDGEQSVEMPVEDGVVGPGAGISGEYIRDLRLEALGGDGAVLARGSLPGDWTPPPGEVRDEMVVLLRTGVFSTVEGLTLSAGRADACAVLARDAVVLVAGGGSAAVSLLDLDRGTVLEVESLDGTYEECRAAAMSDGSVVLAGDAGGLIEVIDRGSGERIAVQSTGRADGALAALEGGDAVWWMGGSEAGGDLTSELMFATEHAAEEGPVINGGARQGHRLVCVGDGETCVVVGAADGSTAWWRLTATAVLHAGPGTAIDPLEHDDADLVGTARGAVRLDDATVVALLEHGGGAALHGLDLGGDGDWGWLGEPGIDGGGTLVAVPGDGAWLIGGHDGGPVDVVARITADGGVWQFGELDASLQRAREGAAAVVLDDGRVVVIGGRDAGGPMTSIEVYQP